MTYKSYKRSEIECYEDNKTIKSRTFYLDDFKYRVLTYNRDGIKTTKISYSGCGDPSKILYTIDYHDDGMTKKRKTKYRYEDMTIRKSIRFRKDGTKKSETSYYHNEKKSDTKFFSRKGRLKLSISYYENGMVESKKKFHKSTGYYSKITNFNEDGSLESINEYYETAHLRKETYFYPNGSEKSISTYDMKGENKTTTEYNLDKSIKTSTNNKEKK